VYAVGDEPTRFVHEYSSSGHGIKEGTSDKLEKISYAQMPRLPYGLSRQVGSLSPCGLSRQVIREEVVQVLVKWESDRGSEGSRIAFRKRTQNQRSYSSGTL